MIDRSSRWRPTASAGPDPARLLAGVDARDRHLGDRVPGLGITGIIFVLVAGLVIDTIVRFRRRTGDRPFEPPQVYGSNRIGMAWTVVPFLIVIVLFLVTARYIWKIKRRAVPAAPARLRCAGLGA